MERSQPNLAARLLGLDPLEFESFVVRLLRSIPGVTEVVHHDARSRMTIDATAIIQGRKVAIEAKRVSSLSLVVAMRFVEIASRIINVTSAARILLIVPTHVTQNVRALLESSGVDCWGIGEIHDRMNNALWGWLEASKRSEQDFGVIKSKATALQAALATIHPGRDQALEFQKLWLDATELLFSPPLEIPQYEVDDLDRRNRRDIIAENFAGSGFWSVARSEYVARYVVIDAKNYSMPIGKQCVLDVSHYLKRHGCGLFALIATRKGMSKSALHAVREHWIAEQKMIIVLDDNDLTRMLKLRCDGADPADVIRERLRCFIFSM